MTKFVKKYPPVLNYFVFNERSLDRSKIQEPSSIQYERAGNLAEIHSFHNSSSYWAEETNQWISKDRLILFGTELGYNNGCLHSSYKKDNICWMVDREGVVWISGARAERTSTCANFDYLTSSIQPDNNFDIYIKERPPLQLLEKFQSYVANIVGVEKTFRRFSSIRAKSWEMAAANNKYLAVHYGYAVSENNNFCWDVVCSGITKYEAYCLAEAVEQTGKETKIVLENTFN